jgi:hypothetical protein
VSEKFLSVLPQDASEFIAPEETMSFCETALANEGQQKQELQFIAQEKRKRPAAYAKAIRARKKAEHQAWFGDAQFVDFRRTSSGEGYEMLILGQTAREMIWVASKGHAPSAEAEASLRCRLLRLVRYLEHVRTQEDTLARKGAKVPHVKFRLTKGLALLIAKGCPSVYLDPALAPLLEMYYGPMLEELEKLEKDFRTKLKLSQREEDK